MAAHSPAAMRCSGGVDAALPVDLRIPGCPPSPLALLKGLLSLLHAADAR